MVSIREPESLHVILRNGVTKNLPVGGRPEILREACPACPERSLGELAEGLRMTMSDKLSWVILVQSHHGFKIINSAPAKKTPKQRPS